jgi:three-Cys-motif partner protein
MNSGQTGHDFGGDWTERKLKVLQAYLSFYTTVLDGFDTWYVDAFAGSGSRSANISVGGLFEERPIEEMEASFAGSATIALGCKPSFKHYRLIENNRGRFAQLTGLKSKFPNADIDCIRGEANGQLRRFFSSSLWTRKGGSQRALVFVDPYGLDVEWQTLETIAATEKVDLWYFFNLEAVTRQMAWNSGKVDSSKVECINRLFGTDAWRSVMYRPAAQGDLWAEPVDERNGDKQAIGEYATKRFKELFSYVSEPIPLNVDRRGHAFSLYCMSNSKSGPALAAIGRGVDAVKRLAGDPSKSMPAFRRKSDP